MNRLLSILFILIAFASKGQIALTNTTHTLEVTTSSASAVDYIVEYFDETANGASVNATSVGEISSATTTTVLTAPGAATTRKVVAMTLSNIGASENIVTVKIDVSGTEYNNLTSVSLRAGESIYYSTTEGWLRSPSQSSAITGLTKNFGNTGTVSDAVSYWYGYWKDAGIAGGAWLPGTPGLSGRATDGTNSADAGCISFPDAGAGKTRYLTGGSITATQIGSFSLWDVLWVNSGLSVTTTTAQTINSVTLPARDDNGTTNGQGCSIGIYATAALGNAGVVSNSTISYTNSDGVAGRTATLNATVPNNFPATPVIGTVIWFELDAGDEGVQSIQSITLNTTLTSGSASIFIARKLIDMPASVANVGFDYKINNGNGVVLYDNACILPFRQSAVTTAAAIQGTITTVER